MKRKLKPVVRAKEYGERVDFQESLRLAARLLMNAKRNGEVAYPEIDVATVSFAFCFDIRAASLGGSVVVHVPCDAPNEQLFAAVDAALDHLENGTHVENLDVTATKTPPGDSPPGWTPSAADEVLLPRDVGSSDGPPGDFPPHDEGAAPGSSVTLPPDWRPTGA